MSGAGGRAKSVASCKIYVDLETACIYVCVCVGDRLWAHEQLLLRLADYIAALCMCDCFVVVCWKSCLLFTFVTSLAGWLFLLLLLACTVEFCLVFDVSIYNEQIRPNWLLHYIARSSAVGQVWHECNESFCGHFESFHILQFTKIFRLRKAYSLKYSVWSYLLWKCLRLSKTNVYFLMFRVECVSRQILMSRLH